MGVSCVLWLVGRGVKMALAVAVDAAGLATVGGGGL
jgi:hypothetical protein